MTKSPGIINSIKPRIREIRLSLYLLSRNRLTRLSLGVVILLVLTALVAPLIVPYPEHIETDTNPVDKLLPPSGKYFFGTDELGRDIFSRVIYGTRISLQTALIAVGLALLIGIPLGAIAGATGGMVDEVIMRITDIFLSFPPLLLAIAIAAFLGPSLENAMLAIAVSWWPWYTRLIRGQAVSIRERQFVKAAKAIGTPPVRIIFGHIVPNCIAPVIVQASMDIGGVILTIASLSFLGLGAQPPTPEWDMVSTSRNYFRMHGGTAFSGLAIFVTVLVFNPLGDGLWKYWTPRQKDLRWITWVSILR